MKQLYRLLFFGIVVILASSCRRNLDSLSISEAESRLLGKWTMTKVESKVRGDGRWGRDDVTGNYRNWEFTFDTDGTLELYVPDEDLHLLGTWEMYEDWETDSDGDSDWNTFLYIFAYDPLEPSTYREFVLKNMSVSNDEFRAVEETFIHGKKVFFYYQMNK